MKRKINKVIALGICIIMLFSAGVFAEEGAAIASENVVVEQTVIPKDENLSNDVTSEIENKIAEPQEAEVKTKEPKKEELDEIKSEGNLEKPEEKLVEVPKKPIENEIPAVEVQEEVVESAAVPILMRGPAGPLRALYPVRVSGWSGKEEEHESVICGESAGITGSYGKETVNRYDRDKELKVTVYREGYLGNMLSVDIYATNGAKVSGGAPYNYVLGPDGGATAWYTDYTIENIDKDASQVEFIIKGQYMYPMGGIATFLRRVTINLSDDRDTPPENVDFIYDRMLRDDAYRLWGIDEKMEYRKLSDTSWTSCDSNQDVYIPIPENDEIYLVRYKASGDSQESKSKQIVLKKRAYAPGVSFDIYSEKMSYLGLDMEYDINNSGKFVPVTQDMIDNGISNIIDSIPNEKACIFKIRKSAGVMPASEVKEINIFGRKEYPTNIILTPNTYTFVGAPANTQYSFDGITWNSLSTVSNNLEQYASADKEVEVYLKILASRNYYSTSKSKLYKLPKFSEMPKTLKLDYYTEAITGLSPNAQYQYVSMVNDKNWRYLPISNVSIPMTKFITASDREIYIREIKDGSTPSVPVKFILPKRQNCPSDINFVYNDVNGIAKATLKNVNSDMEYRVNTNTKWEPTKTGMVFEIPPAKTKYIFRIKAKEGNFASTECTVTLYDNGKYSGAAYNNLTEDIGSLSNLLEWKIENNSYQPYTLNNSNMNMSNVIDAIPVGKTVRVYVRVMTTEKQPQSKEHIITLYSRLPIPTTPSFDKNTKSLLGVSRQMQYRKVGETNWIGISKTNVNLSSLIGNTSNVKIEVRMKPTSTNSASKSKIINCY